MTQGRDEYFDWLESQTMGDEKSLYIGTTTRLPADWRDRPATVGDCDVYIGRDDTDDQLEQAARKMMDSGRLDGMTYRGRPLTNLEMYALTRTTDDVLRIQAFARSFLKWIGVTIDDE